MKEDNGLLKLKYNIKQKKNGKKELVIEVADVYDGLTECVFSCKFKGNYIREYSVRQVIDGKYEESEDFHEKEFLNHYIEEFNTFEEAKKRAEEVIEEVLRNRKKVLIKEKKQEVIL